MVKYQGVYEYYNNWLFIQADPEIGKYYRNLYSHFRYGCDKLQRPEKDSHITIISKYTEKPAEYYKKKYDGLPVDFLLEVENPSDDGTYMWFPVICQHAQDIRYELKLGLPYYPFHLTIGNRKNL